MKKASINSIKIKRFQSVDQNEMILMIMNSSIVGNAGGDHNSINRFESLLVLNNEFPYCRAASSCKKCSGINLTTILVFEKYQKLHPPGTP